MSQRMSLLAAVVVALMLVSVQVSDAASDDWRWAAIGVLQEGNDETSKHTEGRGNLPIGIGRDCSLQAQRSRGALGKCGIPAMVR